MSPFLLRASSASGSVVLMRVQLVGSFLAANLGAMVAGTQSAPRFAAGGGSTRRLGVVVAGALGVGGQAWAWTVGAVTGGSRATGATTAADDPAGQAVEGGSAAVAAARLGSREVSASAGVVATGPRVGATAGTDWGRGGRRVRRRGKGGPRGSACLGGGR